MAKKTTKTKKTEGCGDPRCLWCGEDKVLYGLSHIALRKRFLGMSQAEYLAHVVIPEEFIVN